MLTRLPPDLLAFAGSAVVLAGLVAGLCWISPGGGDVLEIYCAETLREPLTAIAAAYEKEYGQKVRLTPGASQTILVNLELNRKADLFLPADASYMRLAEEKTLVTGVEDVARMRMVVIVNRDYPKKIAAWDDFVAPGIKIGLGNPDATAVGKLVKERLEADGRWDAVERRGPTYFGSVSDVRSSVLIGGVNAGVVWDVIARPVENKLIVVRLPELGKIEAVLQIAVVGSSAQPESARRFIRYLRARNKGAVELRAYGFSRVEEGPALGESGKP